MECCLRIQISHSKYFRQQSTLLCKFFGYLLSDSHKIVASWISETKISAFWWLNLSHLWRFLTKWSKVMAVDWNTSEWGLKLMLAPSLLIGFKIQTACFGMSKITLPGSKRCIIKCISMATEQQCLRNCTLSLFPDKLFTRRHLERLNKSL